MSLVVRPVRDAGSRLGRSFYRFPYGLYSGVPQWVPPLRGGITRILSRKHPFFDHSRGEAFVVTDGDTVVARFLMLEPVLFNQHTGKRDVRLGLPEAVDRDEVWRVLFDHARQWARDHGATRLIGPQHFSPMDGSGILVEGFEERASMTMMPYHPPYYGPRFEAAGFHAYKDFVSGYLSAQGFQIPDKIKRVAAISAKRSGLSAEHPGSRRELRALGAELGRLYNRSWEDHEEFRPLTDRELKNMVNDLLMVTRPDLLTVLRGRQGELAGFVLPFPDLSPALQRADGSLGLRTVLDLRREQKRASHAIVNGLGILPQYRNQGGTALLYTALIQRLLDRGITSAEMTQVAETTDLMLADLGTLGSRVYKRHRVYQMPL
mgnify:CR=1 FL=1